MKIKLTVALLIAGLAAAPAFADKKFDDAVAKAEKNFQKGKLEDARKAIEKLADQQSDNPEAHIMLSLLYQRVGSLDEAMAAAQQAVSVAGTTPAAKANALASLASLELRMAAGADALGHATQAVEAEATPLALAALARANVRVGDVPAAVKAADQAVAAGAGNVAAHEAQGEALAAAGRGTEAVAAFRKALELAPKGPCKLCARGMIELAKTKLAATLIDEGKPAEAATMASEAAQSDENFGEALAVWGAAILAEKPKDPAAWTEAISQAQQGAFVDGKNPAVRMIVAYLFEVGGNVQQAESSYRQALSVDPAFAPARAALIHILVRRKKLDEALAAAQKLVQDAPQSGEAHLALGSILLRKGDYAGAVGPLATAARLLPGRAEAHAFSGTAYQFTGKSAEGAAAYGQAVKLAPDNVGYRTTYGLLLGVAGQHEDGITELKKVVETPGYKDTAGFTNLGWIYRNISPRQPDESVAAYSRALELDPSNAQAALGMGWAHFYAQRYDEAIASFQQSIQIDDKTAPEAHNGLAWSHYYKQDMDGASGFAAQAKQAGRNVASLEEAIEKYKTAVAENQVAAQKAMEDARSAYQKYERQAQLINMMKTGSPEAKARAAREYGRLMGADGVDNLIWAIQQDDLALRLAAVQALGAMGGAARAALPNLKHIMNEEPDIIVNATREQMERDAIKADIRKAARAAVARIGG